MENSENMTIKSKHKKSLIDPETSRTKTLTLNRNNPTIDSDIHQQNNIPKNSQVNPNRAQVPIMLSQYYPAQPQLIPNNSPYMVNMTVPVKVPNAYIANQISPGVSDVTRYHINKVDDIDNEICPHCYQKTHAELRESCNCLTCFFYTISCCVFPIYFIYFIWSFCEKDPCHEASTCDCNCKGCCDSDCDCKCCIDSNYYCTKCGKITKNKKNSCHEFCSCLNCCNCLWYFSIFIIFLTHEIAFLGDWVEVDYSVTCSSLFIFKFFSLLR